jgi:hypothetical protein
MEKASRQNTNSIGHVFFLWWPGLLQFGWAGPRVLHKPNQWVHEDSSAGDFGTRESQGPELHRYQY